MQQKLSPAKVFNINGKATKKHDEMLLSFTSESTKLREYCEASIKHKIIEHKNKNKVKIFLITLLDGEKTWLRLNPTFKSAYDNNLYYYDKYQPFDYQIESWVRGSDVYKKDFEESIEKKIIIKIANIEEIECDAYFENVFKITKWQPEKPIINRGYYIGSIDLWVEFEYTIITNLILDKKHVWKYFKDNIIIDRIAFEFKPEITSYSETIRQVNVYKTLMPATYHVITNSDVGKFQSIFESQEIKIYNL